MADAIVHTRWKSTDHARPHRFPFNFGPAALDHADYEIWVCGTPAHYYLLPVHILREYYVDSRSQRDRRHQKLAVVTVYADRHEAVFSHDVRLNLAAYLGARVGAGVDPVAPAIGGATPASRGDRDPALAPAAASGADPLPSDAARLAVWRRVVERPAQPAFRRALIERFGGRCVLSGCDAPAALEAAHILPVADGGGDEPDNGLLLRADLHLLFDLGLLGIDSSVPHSRVSLVPALAASTYGELEGRVLQADLSAGQRERLVRRAAAIKRQFA